MSFATKWSLFAERLVRSYRQQKTYKALNALDAHQLADIGLTASTCMKWSNLPTIRRSGASRLPANVRAIFKLNSFQPPENLAEP